MNCYTPRRRMEIKKELHEGFKNNFSQIENKNYDLIIASSIKNLPKKKSKKKDSRAQLNRYQEPPIKEKKNVDNIYDQTSFNFNKLSGW